MPTPDRTSLEEIIQAGRDILESDGLARLTMQAVADRVGVRAPSLYKRVASRDDLIGYIAEATVHDLAERLSAAVGGADARADLTELARAFRAFAHERPGSFHLIFASGPEASRPNPASIVEASAPVLRLTTELVGPQNALEAARLVTAWANGFINMELSGAFNLGGDVDRAFEFGIAHLAATLGVPALRRAARTSQPRRAARGVP
jgi:AcrR family transcriptional regulator